MKPIILVIYNYIRFSFMKMTHNYLKTDKILLLGMNSRLVFHKSAKVTLGERIISDGRLVMIVDRNAVLNIGAKVYFNEATMISSKNAIKIGDGCQFGPNVKIIDNNHLFDPEHGVSNEHSAAPIKIGEKCWIGANAVILKGVTIGRNSVIGAGCVITQDIPECSVVTQERTLRIKPMMRH